MASAADTGGMKNKMFAMRHGPGLETTVEPIPDGVDPKEFLRQQMDDCPLCREARARGEVPVFGTGADLEQMVRTRRKLFAKRPRWRTMKKRR